MVLVFESMNNILIRDMTRSIAALVSVIVLEVKYQDVHREHPR
jgi:hypothetical protein